MDNQNVSNVQETSVVQNTQVGTQPVVQAQDVQQVQAPQQQVPQDQANVKPKKKSHLGVILLFLIIIGLAGVCYMLNQKLQDTTNYYKNYYTPVNASKEKKLELNNTLVVQLYNMYKTTADEDYYGYKIKWKKWNIY